MGRKKTTVLQDIVDIGTMIPWWASAGSAIVLYLVFHHYSQITIPQSTGTADFSKLIISSVIKTGSTFAQYIVPGLLIAGMLVRLARSFARKKTYTDVVADKSGNKLAALTWVQFEDLVNQYFLERDFRVTATKEGPDGGVDLRLSKDGRVATVQCKHWHSRKVGVSLVREQFGIMMAEKADQCFVVTSGKFTREAEKWAKGKAISLIDGDQLRYLLGIFAFDPFRESRLGQPHAVNPTNCSVCGAEMVLRTAKRGRNAGSQFWGCSAFPKCRNTVAIAG